MLVHCNRRTSTVMHVLYKESTVHNLSAPRCINIARIRHPSAAHRDIVHDE